MAHLSTPPLQPIPIDVRQRRWMVQVVSLLLFVQSISLAFYGVRVGLEVYDRIGHVSPGGISLLFGRDALLALVAAGTVILAIIGLITALFFWFARRGAWLQAMVIQGVLLAYYLWQYVTGSSEPLDYLFMFSCIVIVLYLNSSDVRLTFYAGIRSRRPRRKSPRP